MQEDLDHDTRLVMHPCVVLESVLESSSRPWIPPKSSTIIETLTSRDVVF